MYRALFGRGSGGARRARSGERGAAASPELLERYGPWALVAGGSLGLGAAYARQLAALGFQLVLVAEQASPLEAFADELRAQYGIQVDARVLDLGRADSVAALRPALEGREVGLFIYNAAYSRVSPYLELSSEEQLRMLDVNCRGPLLLLSELVPRLATRATQPGRRGGVILMSSLSAFQGTALVSVYAATKAFNLVLGEALWDELRGLGVDVLAWCPGPTRTPGYAAAGARPGGPLAPPVMEPEDVVRQALAALGTMPSGIPGQPNRLSRGLLRLLPRRLVVEVVGREMRRQFTPAGS